MCGTVTSWLSDFVASRSCTPLMSGFASMEGFYRSPCLLLEIYKLHDAANNCQFNSVQFYLYVTKSRQQSPQSPVHHFLRLDMYRKSTFLLKAFFSWTFYDSFHQMNILNWINTLSHKPIDPFPKSVCILVFQEGAGRTTDRKWVAKFGFVPKIAQHDRAPRQGCSPPLAERQVYGAKFGLGLT